VDLNISVSIIWDDGNVETPSVDEVALLLSEFEGLLQEMQTYNEADEA
jgi:hypothetical protein